jgi:hypothetical protein
VFGLRRNHTPLDSRLPVRRTRRRTSRGNDNESEITPEGKACVSQNALKHGPYATKPILLPIPQQAVGHRRWIPAFPCSELATGLRAGMTEGVLGMTGDGADEGVCRPRGTPSDMASMRPNPFYRETLRHAQGDLCVKRSQRWKMGPGSATRLKSRLVRGDTFGRIAHSRNP